MRRAAPFAAALAALAGCGGGSATRHSSRDYGRIAMAFERNEGQAPAGVRMLARGPGYTLLLGARAPVLRLARAGTLALGLSDTSPGMRLRAAGRRLGRVNYLVGPRRAWHRGVPTWSAARYTSAYPGIDVAFHGTDRRLEFDFEVAPGADPARIALAPRGQRALRLARDGALELVLPGGVVREHRPRTWQGGRRIPSWFVIHSDGTVGIDVGPYDHSAPLTIDPVLTYGSYLGGTSFDIGNGVAVDATGAAYVAGTTASSDFPATTGAQQTGFAGNQDAFVAKLAPDGRSLAWATYLGGGGIDIANDIAVDASGAAYVAGSTTSNDLPTTLGAFQTAYGGGSGDGFAVKLSPDGTALAYSTYLGGSGLDSAIGIAVTGGAAIVTGSAGSSNFPTTAGAPQTAFQGGASDAFVTRLNATGSAPTWSTYLGGASTDAGARVAVDASGNAYVAGRTQSGGFPTTGGAAQTVLKGTADAFVAKLSVAGTVQWSTLLGGSGTDSGDAIAVDDAGAPYVTGATSSTDLPGAQNSYGGGANDAYLAKLGADGGSVAFSTYLGGSAADLGRGVAVDAAHDAFVGGQTASADFPVTGDAFETTYPGGSNAAFLAKLTPAGARSFATFYGGTAGTAALSLALDGSANAYLTGSTSSTDLPVTPGAAQGASGGSTDAFVAKLTAPPPATTTTPATTTPTTSTPTTTTEQPAATPTIETGPVRIRWNQVSVAFRLKGGAAIVLDVVTPKGRHISADLAAGATHGTLRWNRKVGTRVAPPGHYHLTLTASNTEGGETDKHLGATLGILYAHAPRIRAGAARIAYELTEPARVTLSISRGTGPRTVVATQQGRRGPNRISWDLLLHGRRVAGGAYRLFVSARGARGRAASVAVPSR